MLFLFFEEDGNLDEKSLESVKRVSGIMLIGVDINIVFNDEFLFVEFEFLEVESGIYVYEFE